MAINSCNLKSALLILYIPVLELCRPILGTYTEYKYIVAVF